jgi:hypothetical protein
MRKNLLKQLILALLMTIAVPCVNAQIARVGDILCTNGVYVSPANYEASGLEAMGVIFYVNSTGQHGWAVALEDTGSFKFVNVNSPYTPLPDYSTIRAAIYDVDGQFNTQEILAFESNSNYFFPAVEALDVANGWYLPAIGQLNYLYGNLVEVNEGLAAAGGALFIMNNSWGYWSSTEGNSSWWVLYSTGKIALQAPNNTHLVRGVRNF